MILTLCNLASLRQLCPRRAFFVLSLLLLSLSSLSYASALTSNSPFNKQAIEQLKQHYKGQPWIMIFWSVDCPPCFKELALVDTLQQELGPLPIVIVNADDSEEVTERRQQVMNQFNLLSLTHLYFEEDQAMRNRFLIDPSWYGELPRSYFIDSAGQFRGKSGLITRQHIQQWLSLNQTVKR